MRNNKLIFIPNGDEETTFFIGRVPVERPKRLKNPVIIGNQVICAITKSADRDYPLTRAELGGAYLDEEVETPGWLVKRAEIKSV